MRRKRSPVHSGDRRRARESARNGSRNMVDPFRHNGEMTTSQIGQGGGRLDRLVLKHYQRLMGSESDDRTAVSVQ